MKNKIKRERWTKYNFKALKTIYKNLINNKVQYNTNKKETIIRKTEYPCSNASLKKLDLYSNMFIMRIRPSVTFSMTKNQRFRPDSSSNIYLVIVIVKHKLFYCQIYRVRDLILPQICGHGIAFNLYIWILIRLLWAKLLKFEPN